LATVSKIEWTDSSWNPVTGCTRISSGCQNCYAQRMAKRLKAMGNPRYTNGFKVTLHWDLINAPYEWKKPRRIFVNSMSDLFHEDVPVEFIKRVFDTMNNTPWHTYQVLTKRSERLLKLAPLLNWTPNIWQGVSIENQEVVHRLEHLREVPAHVKFLSLEPLLGPLSELRIDKIHWVIVGGESGPRARPIKPEWVRELRDNCIENDVPFFFKQWGGTRKHLNGRLLDGQTWDQYPDEILEDMLATV
jgi:protein gp37